MLIVAGCSVFSQLSQCFVKICARLHVFVNIVTNKRKIMRYIFCMLLQGGPKKPDLFER